jgi:hypothetical protein
MFRLIGRSYARAKSASVGLDLPHASARFTFVVVGFLIVAFAIVSNTSVVPGILDGLGSGVFWFGVVATAGCAYSAGMCLSRARWSRQSRLVGAAVGMTTLYMLSVLCSYEPRQEPWLSVSRLLWPSIPIALALWARASFALTGQLRRTRGTAPKFWVGTTMRARSLSRRRVQIFGVRVPYLELGTVWVPCVVLSVMGLVPRFMYGEAQASSSPWLGWTSEPRWPYVLFGAWAIAVLAVSALIVEAAWQCRRQGVFAGVLVRARGSRVATKWAIVIVAAGFISAWTSSWPEPLLDVPLMALFLFYALRSIDADSYRDAAHAYSSIRRRWIWAIGWIPASVIFAAGLSKGPVMTGVYAAMIALLYPLFPAGMRAKEGIAQADAEGPRRPERLTAAAAEELAAILAGSEATGVPIDREALHLARRFLESLTPEEFRLLTGGLPTHEGKRPTRERDPREYTRLRRFIGQLPALDAHGDFDARLYRFELMFYDTVMNDPLVSQALTRQRENQRHNPTSQWIVRAYCLQRISAADTAEEEDEEALIRSKYSVWLRRRHNGSQSDHRPVYYWIGGKNPELEIANMTAEQLCAAKKALVGREVFDTSKKQRDRALHDARTKVRSRWLQRLEDLEDARDHPSPLSP